MMNPMKFELKSENIRFDILAAMNYAPKIRRKKIDTRLTSSLVLIVRGEYKYKYKSSELILRSGDFVYLPKGSIYSYEISSKNAYTLQIEFELFDRDEPLILSDAPSLISRNNGPEIELLFYDVIRGKDSVLLSEKLLSRSAFLHLLSIGFKSLFPQDEPNYRRYDKIAPALIYIENNFSKKIAAKELSELCSLSQTHMRRLFSEELGMSPVKYKNKLLIKNACDLLKTGVFNISEAAESLGFKDIYTFSQVFKRETGMSPSEFIKSAK